MPLWRIEGAAAALCRLVAGSIAFFAVFGIVVVFIIATSRLVLFG